MTNHPIERETRGGVDAPMTRQEIEARLAELDAEREEIETALADIRGQIAKSSAEYHAGTGGRDAAWYQRAKVALRYKGADHQTVLREIGALRRALKSLNMAEEAKKPKEKPFALFFYRVAESQLDPQVFQKLFDQALALKEELA